MKIRNAAISAILLFSVFFAAACGAKNPEPEGSAGSEYTDSLGTVNRFAGVVIASGETKIEKDPAKTVAAINVAVGDTVKAGQVLFVYDGTQAQNSYDKAVIELEQQRISLQASYDQRAELEAQKAAAADADSQLSYTLEIQNLDTSIREASYNITQKEKEVQSLAAGLGTLEVKATTDGKVQSINAGGDQGGGSGTAGQPFMVIMRTNAYRVQAYVNELNAGDLQVGDAVTILSRTDERTWSGKVASVDFGNPSSAQSGGTENSGTDVSTSSRYPVVVDLDSSDGLMLGQHVFIEPAASASSGTQTSQKETEGASK